MINLDFDDRIAVHCKQGTTFVYNFSYTDKTGVNAIQNTSTLKMQVRDNYNGKLIAELSTENGRISVDSNYEVQLYISHSDTASMPFGNYIYDLIMTDGNIKTPLMSGVFKITQSVTKQS